jgi:anti-sigma B factor antagonist
MKASVRQIGHVSVVDLSGKITIGEGDVVLRDNVQSLLDDGNKAILLNLEKVSYMDSAGIGELVACYKRAKENDGVVKLLNPSGKVYDLLQLTKLEEVFDTYRDEKEALVAF